MTVVAGKSSDEDYAAFRKVVEQRASEGKRELSLRMMLPREQRFVADLTRFYAQARWILVLHAFPDGGPLIEQTAWQLEVWSIFVQAIEARQAGATVEPSDPNEGGE